MTVLVTTESLSLTLTPVSEVFNYKPWNYQIHREETLVWWSISAFWPELVNHVAAPEEILQHFLRCCSKLRSRGGAGSWRLIGGSWVMSLTSGVWLAKGPGCGWCVLVLLWSSAHRPDQDQDQSRVWAALSAEAGADWPDLNCHTFPLDSPPQAPPPNTCA